MSRRRGLLAAATALLALACCAAPALAARQLKQLGYIPPTNACKGLELSLTAESDRSWWASAPELRGRVTVRNPHRSGVWLSSLQVVAASRGGGESYATDVRCDGASAGGGVWVPSSPVPYEYGSLVCSYRLPLDRWVAQQRTLGYDRHRQHGYYVYATADTGASAPCDARPVDVDSGSWWAWLSETVFGGGSARHHHGSGGSGHGQGWIGSGLGPSGNGAGSTVVVGSSAPQAVAAEAGQQAPEQLPGASADAGADAAEQPPGGGEARRRRLLLTGTLMPTDCASSGLGIAVSATLQRNADATTASAFGTVTLFNPGAAFLPLQQGGVRVTLGNTIAFEPIFAPADCGGTTVVPPGGAIQCSFAAMLPRSGLSADPGVWTTASASASLTPDVTCTSAVSAVLDATGGQQPGAGLGASAPLLGSRQDAQP